MRKEERVCFVWYKDGLLVTGENIIESGEEMVCL